MKRKESEITKRLNELVDAIGTNANRLSKDVGGTTTKYYKLLAGDTIPNWETIASILEVYPQISAEWLIRGIGPMVKSNGPEYHQLAEENAMLKSEVVVLEKMLKSELGKKFRTILTSPGELYRIAGTAESKKMLVRIRRSKPGYGQKKSVFQVAEVAL